MKRSNFTFLFLFALLGLASNQLWSQSGLSTGTACAGEINVSVGDDCSWLIDGDDLGSAYDLADSIWVYPHDPHNTYTGSGTAGGPFLFQDKFPKGLYIYELHGGGQMVCWGHINIEHKQYPPKLTNTDSTDCVWYDVDVAKNGSYSGWPKFNLDNILNDPTKCYAWPTPGSKPRITITKEEDDVVCDRFYYIRTIDVEFTVDKKKVIRTLRCDTTIVTPIVKSEVCWPGEVEVECDLLPAGSPLDATDKGDHEAISALLSPENLRKYLKLTAANDTLSAPYVKKEAEVVKDSAIICIEERKFGTGEYELVQVITKDGDEIWTEVEKFDWFCVKTDTVKVDDCDTYVPAASLCKQVTTGTNLNTQKADYPICLGSCTTIDTLYTPLPKGRTCNIHVKCVDWVLEGECEKLPTIMRNWEIIDWCDPAKSVWEYVQWVKVVDDTDPTITPIDDVWASIAPWTCEGVINVDPKIKDWSGYHVDYDVTEGYIVQSGNKATIRGLWASACPVTVTVTATDWCGNSSTETFDVYLKDDVPPVAIAEDELNVTLTGTEGEGIAKVYAEDIDAGSHDAGCGKVWTCVLRKDELADPILYCVGFDAHGKKIYDQVLVDGQPAYHPHGCQIDGEVEIVEECSGKTPTKRKVPYVLCKEYVKFCCEDVGEDVFVALVVSDNAADNPCKAPNHKYYNNYSHSWTKITVEDKSAPIIICPEDVHADCSQYEDVKLPEVKEWSAICGDKRTFTADALVGPDACGGHEYVNYRDEDGNVVCTITVYYDGGSRFDPLEIKWPKHYDGTVYDGIRRECEAVYKDSEGVTYSGVVEYYDDVQMGEAFTCDGDILVEPTWCSEACALVQASYEDDVAFEATDACVKIIRRWTIIDWCEWEPNNGAGYDTPDDENDSGENFEAVDDTWMPNPTSPIAENGDLCVDCEKRLGSSDPVYFRYTNVKYDGYYTFDQVIKIVDTTDPVIEAPEPFEVSVTAGNSVKDGANYDGCVGSSTLTATAADMCMESALDPASLVWWVERVRIEGTKVTVEATKAGTGATIDMGTGTSAPGVIKEIRWLVKDGCGNTAKATTPVTFADTKNPTPVCLQDISTATMNVDGSSVAIWASDYDLGSYDNCSDVEVYFKDADGNVVPSLSFGCADIVNGISHVFELKMYVADETGNEDYCYVTLRVDDNVNICADSDAGPIASIAGAISTELGDMLESARVSLNKSNVDLTSVEGKYAFNNTPMYNTYEITAKKNDDFLNGVTTLDLVLIQKHVLGIEALNSPYKVIAADINSDTRITAADLVELRKLILGVYTEFPSNDSWRFVDAKQTFADANDPFPFTEALTLTLNGNVTDQNFRGVKIGDASGSAIANSLIAAGTRSAGTLSLEISDMALNAGTVVTVPVRGANFSDIAAYQFTMDVRGLELTGVQSGAIAVSAENFAQLNANTITTAWNTANAVNASDVLFTMTFKATASGQLSEALAISSRVTQSVAYTGNNGQLDIALSFNGVSANEFALFQNEPNPFDNVTKIGFQLAKSGAATLTVFDVTGKTVSVVRGEFNKGYNEIRMNKSDLNASGVLYYQLESGDFTATKKMVIVE